MQEEKIRTLRMKPFVDVFHQGKWIVPRTLLEFENFEKTFETSL